MSLVVGQEVVCNGVRGVVVEVCAGQLAGMVVVRLPRGSVCVDVLDVRAVGGVQ